MSIFPNWNSIDSMRRADNFCFWIGIIFFFLVLVFEVTARIYGGRKDALIEMRDRNTAIQRQREIEESQGKHDAESKALREELDAAANNTTGNLITGYTFGASVNFGDACYVGSDSGIYLACASNTAAMPAPFIAANSGTAGAAAILLRSGLMKNNSWTWNVGGTNGAIWVSNVGTTGNTLTQTQGTNTGNVIQLVGQAMSAESILVELSPDYGVLA